MESANGTETAAQATIEAFETASRPQMLTRPVREAVFDEVVGQGQTEITPERGDRFRLAGTIKANDLEVATQDGGIVFGLPDGLKVLEDGFAMTQALLRREVFRRLEVAPNVA